MRYGVSEFDNLAGAERSGRGTLSFGDLQEFARVKGNCTLSFWVSLKRKRTGGPGAGRWSFSFRVRRGRESPASAAVISRALLRMSARSWSTSRVSERAMPMRLSWSSSWAA